MDLRVLSMPNAFFDEPILNSPYASPGCHWELDESGQPTQKIIESRRRAEKRGLEKFKALVNNCPMPNIFFAESVLNFPSTCTVAIGALQDRTSHPENQ
jgi:hypothetical protein